MRYPDACGWARDHSLASVPSLARLESYAFLHHPEIVATFSSEGTLMAKVIRADGASVAKGTINVLSVVVGILVLLAPVVGVAVYGRAAPHGVPTAEPLSAAVAVPVSAFCFLVSALTQMILWITWLRGGARWSPGRLWLAAIAAALAGFASAGLPNVAKRDGFSLGAWIWPVWATVVLAVSLVLGILIRHRVREPEPLSTISDGRAGVGGAGGRTLIWRLPQQERGVLQADRDDALRILADRGLLDDATLQLALVADLGTLYLLDPVGEEPS